MKTNILKMAREPFSKKASTKFEIMCVPQIDPVKKKMRGEKCNLNTGIVKYC